jgi:type II secretory pathway component GspD/PulD (secretin)
MTRHRSPFATLIIATALSITCYGQAPEAPRAPEAPKAPQPPPSTTDLRQPYGPKTMRVFIFKNIVQQQDGNEILTALRNIIDPRDHIVFVSSQNTIIMDAPVEEIAKAEKIIEALDKPKKTYRITYTLIDLDGTKRLGDQHYAMVLASGQRTVLKQGNKIPVVTGTDLKNPNNPQNQIAYLDIGMNFDATLDEAPSSLRLKTKVEQSSLLEDRSGTVAQDPVIRQSVFEGSANLIPGKPLTIGSLDIAGSTRRIEIQITVEPITQ